MICWYCHWGWPRVVRDIYDRAYADIEALGEDGEMALEFGPAHVVWSDENWDCAAWCLTECDSPRFADWEPAVLEIVRRSLRELDALPDSEKYVRPVGYDGLNPENFPPPPGVEMDID